MMYLIWCGSLVLKFVSCKLSTIMWTRQNFKSHGRCLAQVVGKSMLGPEGQVVQSCEEFFKKKDSTYFDKSPEFHDKNMCYIRENDLTFTLNNPNDSEFRHGEVYQVVFDLLFSLRGVLASIGL